MLKYYVLKARLHGDFCFLTMSRKNRTKTRTCFVYFPQTGNNEIYKN